MLIYNHAHHRIKLKCRHNFPSFKLNSDLIWFLFFEDISNSLIKRLRIFSNLGKNNFENFPRFKEKAIFRTCNILISHYLKDRIPPLTLTRLHHFHQPRIPVIKGLHRILSFARNKQAISNCI